MTIRSVTLKDTGAQIFTNTLVLLDPQCASLVENEIEYVRNLGERSVYRMTHSDLNSTYWSLASNPTCAPSLDVFPVHMRRARCSDPYMGYQSYLVNTGVYDLWTAGGTDGSGVSIIVVDDGVTDHYDAVVSERFDQTDGAYLSAGYAYGAHGTSVASVACAPSNQIGICGAAPAARLVDVNLLAANHFVSDLQEAMAFDDVHIGYAAVYCSSWGPTDDGRCEAAGDLLVDALRHGVETGRGGAGALYVFAAGNGGPDENSNDDGYANHPYTIAVAASNEDAPAYFTEWGASISLAAPGYQLLAANNYNGYTYFYGTSASAPLVSGVVALMIEARPDLGWRDVQDILMLSATMPSSIESELNAVERRYNYFLGHGIVRGDRAVNLARAWTALPARRSVTRALDDGPRFAPVLAAFSLEDAPAMRVEHVELCLSAEGDARSLVVWVESPSGTRALLAKPSHRVSSTAGCSYADRFCFRSLMQWGESSFGVWTAFVGQPSHTGAVVHSLSLTVHGSDAGAAPHSCLP